MVVAGAGAASPLARAITRVICSAANGATIDIKSMFILASNGTFMRRLAADLHLMHRYHHVRTNIFVDRGYYTNREWSQFRRLFPFARIGWCLRACHSQKRGAISHSKWITVSRLAGHLGGGPAVLSTSANLSTQQVGAHQSGILVLRNQVLYQAFLHEWHSDQNCHRLRQCTRPVTPAQWRGANGVDVYFTPASDNPIIGMLATLECTPGSTVSVMSMGIAQPKFVEVLRHLAKSGCTVHTLLNPRLSNAAAVRAGTVRCEPQQHDKAVIVNAGSVRTVIAGSLDFNYLAEHASDNQMVRTSRRSVWQDYQSYFNRGWQHGRSCPIVHGRH